MFAAIDGNHNPSIPGRWSLVGFTQNQRIPPNLSNFEHRTFDFQANIDVRGIPNFMIDQHGLTLIFRLRPGLCQLKGNVNRS